MSDFRQHLEEHARLTMLRELASQADGRLNEALLQEVLDAFAFERSRDWVRTQMRKLQELGAITITEVGPILVAEITRAGLDHVERRSVIEGIKRPSPGV